MKIDMAVKRNVDTRQTHVFRLDCPKSLSQLIRLTSNVKRLEIINGVALPYAKSL